MKVKEHGDKKENYWKSVILLYTARLTKWIIKMISSEPTE